MTHFLTIATLVSALAVAPAVCAETTYISVPASAFSPISSAGKYRGNDSGTARSFLDSDKLIAPLFLPHNSRISKIGCWGRNAKRDGAIIFRLRENTPQQANDDLAVFPTNRSDRGFQFARANRIKNKAIKNSRSNYYLMAEHSQPATKKCASCEVGACLIELILP